MGNKENPFDAKLYNASGQINTTSLGYQYVITTLSEIKARVTRQKFFEIPISDFMPVDVGEAAWSDEIVQNREFFTGDTFETGDVGNLDGNGRIAQVSAGLAPIRMPTMTWAKHIKYSIAEIETAARGAKWDVVSAKLESLKKNWDLGIQRIAFLGHRSNKALTGLLNNAEATINTATITKSVSSMTAAEFQSFVATLLGVYYDNTESTALPDTLVMPMSDLLGLGAAASPEFPVQNKIQYLTDTFRSVTGNANARILGLPYAQADRNGLGVNRYALYRNDPDVLTLNIPVDFTLREVRTDMDVYWNQPAIGQYSGVLVTRPQELMYFDYSA